MSLPCVPGIGAGPGLLMHSPKVKIALATVPRDQHDAQNVLLQEALAKDEYFQDVDTPDPVWCLAHVTYVRNTCDMLGSVADVEEAFGKHTRALETLGKLAKSLTAASQQLNASKQAIKKAKEAEAKAGHLAFCCLPWVLHMWQIFG